jgi:hypothetical protein
VKPMTGNTARNLNRYYSNRCKTIHTLKENAISVL